MPPASPTDRMLIKPLMLCRKRAWRFLLKRAEGGLPVRYKQAAGNVGQNLSRRIISITL